MLNRREVFQVAAGTGVLVAMPSIVHAHMAVVDRIMQNYQWHDDFCMWEQLPKFIEAMVKDCPDLYPLDRIMDCPANFVHKGKVLRKPHGLLGLGSVDLVSVVSRSRAYYTYWQYGLGKWTLTEFAYHVGDDAAKSLNREMMWEWGRLNYVNGAAIYPYMPIIPFRAVDPYTLQPRINFKTRYGVC